MPPTCAGGSLPYMCRSRSHQSSQQHVVILRTAGKPYREDVAYRHVSDPKCRCEKHECKEWQQYRCLRKKTSLGQHSRFVHRLPPNFKVAQSGARWGAKRLRNKSPFMYDRLVRMKATLKFGGTRGASTQGG